MAKYLVFALAATVILGDGYLSGRWNGRWQTNDAPAEAAAKIQKLPLNIGDWQGQEQTLDQRVVERAEFAGYVARTYTRSSSRGPVTVNLLLACGRPGPLSVHTPQVCYGGDGYALSGDPNRCTPAQAENALPAEFWKATFAKRTADEEQKLRVLWSWNKQGVWAAPSSPRWTLAGAPVIYKLYVTQPFDPQNETGTDAAADFVREFLPVFDKVVNPDR